ncbi:MAG: 4-(cytidine 5'-diphospho)-2-C-methyl-D-erythritol kinase, partial [Elusimicrobia bacterium CG06_land_8_20_14_3_00_38_11]
MVEIKLKANAKINLFLDILNKRKDGYHNIRTIFQEISLTDEIYVREIKNGIKIFCAHPKVPTNKTNLVYKAADLLKKHSGIKKGILIKIKKNIPVGGGLGGGSSDAAAVLKGLNKLWNLKLTKNQLAGIGKKIGADVPFFIYGGRCL